MHCQEGILKYPDATNLLKDEKDFLFFFLKIIIHNPNLGNTLFWNGCCKHLFFGI